MNRDRLLDTARKLPHFEDRTYQEYAAKAETLIARINTRMLERDDIGELVGPVNLQMMKDNHANHVRFIASILHSFDAEVLVETVLWVFRAYRSRDFHTGYWAAQMNAWLEILPTELGPETFREIRPLYEWMQVNIPIFTGLTESEGDGAADALSR